jgi:hypothetical protein
MGKSGRSFDSYGAIRRFREQYSEHLRSEERRDKIGVGATAVFLWFFISFWSLGLYEMVFGDWHVTFRTAQGVVEVLGAAVFGALVTPVALLAVIVLGDGSGD